MGGIGIISAIISIFIFSFILFFFSFLYSYFFSKTGRNLLYRDLYECGFRAINDNRLNLDFHFSLIGLIFLIYEMEIVIFVPIFLNLYNLNFFFSCVLIFSLLIIGISYLYEWRRYGLDWSF